MRFIETELRGAYVIEPERLEDERGFFARTFCRREFEQHGLCCDLAQCSISFNRKRGTLRGMHYQAPPHEETKLVRVTRGAVHDVIIDLRPGSPTLHHWIAATLTAENRLSLYVPAGFAHGFQTLEDSTEVFYEISTFYVAEAGRGVRWDDSAFGITWPLEPTEMAARDKNFPNVERLAIARDDRALR